MVVCVNWVLFLFTTETQRSQRVDGYFEERRGFKHGDTEARRRGIFYWVRRGGDFLFGEGE